MAVKILERCKKGSKIFFFLNGPALYPLLMAQPLREELFFLRLPLITTEESAFARNKRQGPGIGGLSMHSFMPIGLTIAVEVFLRPPLGKTLTIFFFLVVQGVLPTPTPLSGPTTKKHFVLCASSLTSYFPRTACQ